MMAAQSNLRATIIAAVTVMIVIAGLVMIRGAVIEREELLGGTYRQLAQGDKRPLAPAGAVRDALLAAPIDQRLVNLWWVGQDGATRQAPEAIAMLDAGGYRHTPAQVNLMQAAIAAGDVDALIRHLDALYRRRESPELMIQILAALEQDPGTRGRVVAILAGDPAWRSVYMTDPAPLRTRAGLAARRATLERLAAQRSVVRGELQVASHRALMAGDAEGALALWRIGRVLPVAGGEPFPFDWRLSSSSSLAGAAVPKGAATTMTIDWNGFGTPVLAQRFVALSDAAGRDVVIGRLAGIRPDELAMRMRCRSGGWLPMRREVEGAGLRFAAPESLDCAIAEQVILIARSRGEPVAASFDVAGA